MEKLNDKQRQIIRLAFQSKNKELRKKAAQRIMEARYKGAKLVCIAINDAAATRNASTWACQAPSCSACARRCSITRRALPRSPRSV